MSVYPYEILIRLNRDKTLRGAHFKEIRVTPAEAGFAEKEEEGEAQPLNIATTKHGIELEPILGAIIPGLIADIDAKALVIADLEKQLADKTTDTETAASLVEATARIADLETAKGSLETANASLGEQQREAVAALAAEQEAHGATKTALEAAPAAE